MEKKVAISQSNYIPWKGYFDFINKVDEFILYDEAQYTKGDWRNRNKIKTPHGEQWLTIPVTGSITESINEVEVAENDWNETHWETIRHMYNKAPHFDYFAPEFERLYNEATFDKLSLINHHFLEAINKILGISTPLRWSSEYDCYGNKSERVLSICKQANADVYVSGPTAKAYLNTDLFKDEGIDVEWMNYEGYKEYPQLYGDFEHSVSIIDLLFNTGKNAVEYLESKEIELV